MTGMCQGVDKMLVNIGPDSLGRTRQASEVGIKRGQGKTLAGFLLCLVGRTGLSFSWPGSALVWLKFPIVAEACAGKGHQEKTV